MNADGMSNAEISAAIGVHHNTVATFVTKYLAAGFEYAINDSASVLDNHSAHTSKETQRYLASRPGRFEFVFTPKHGSWLNLIESFFGKQDVPSISARNTCKQ